MTATKTRRKPSIAAEERKTEIELAVQGIDDDAADFLAFMHRWGTRYNEKNLRRLWIQAPRATCLHKFNTWRGMGRQVRKGEKAILLMHPRTGFDPEKVTANNPDGKVFYGASWMALFDYAQTELIGDFTEAADGADPDLLAEVQRLRMAAVKLHPDVGGTHEEFVTAWALYEQARKRLDGKS